MTPETQPQLDQLRRRATVKMLRINTTLIGRPTPWGDTQSIARLTASSSGPTPTTTSRTDGRNPQAWSGTPPTSRPDRARKAAQALISDARRGPAMSTAVEQHLTGLGRAQLANVVAALFDELATLYESQS
jgi:hypothetical protein